MARPIIAGIDIGTYHIKTVIAKEGEDGMPIVLGAGIAESRGVRHGYITNPSEVAQSIQASWAHAVKQAGVKPRRAFVSVGGIGLGSVVVSSAVVVSRADSEITHLDIEKVHEQCEKDIPPATSLNRKIIHNIPLQYKIDGRVVLGRPEGMKANRLEVKMLFITCLEHHLNDALEAVSQAGIGIEDVMASPIAASLVTLSKSQKIAGCVLANIGAETVSIVVYENNIPVSLEVFPIGSTDITNDIALGLKVPLEEAEQIKVGHVAGTNIPRKRLEEIIEARLSDIFDLIEAHLKKIGRSGLLPAGIVITGGGSHLSNIEEMARAALRLPSRRGSIIRNPGEKSEFKSSTWAVAYGLCMFGMHAELGPNLNTGSGMRLFNQTQRSLIAWIKKFLP